MSRSASQVGISQRLFVLGAVLVQILSICQPTTAGFVSRNGSQLYLDGKPFYYVGCNAVWMIDAPHKDIDVFYRYAKDLGLKVVRVWGFNSKLPSASGVYDEAQFRQLDYIIAAADKHGMKMSLALGNLWTHYRAPEDWVKWATGSATNKTILDFYNDGRTKELYKQHIKAILTRNNTYSKKLYKDDDTIMGWGMLNEPRCPGCLDGQLPWLKEMARYAKQLAPKHLIISGTEGFFVPESGKNLYRMNPGAGAQCEGEDSVKINRLDSLDVGTIHLYERHMELRPPNWTFCDFPCLMAWMPAYLQTHMGVAERDKKPLLIEETGITTNSFADPSARKVWMQHVFDVLVASKRAGKPLVGVMFWQATLSYRPDWDGYSTHIDYNRTNSTASTGRRMLHAGASMAGWRSLVPAFGDAEEEGLMSRIIALVTGQHGPTKRRRSLQGQDHSDPFRRTLQRSLCAEANSGKWLPANITAPASLYQSLLKRTEKLSMVDIIGDAADRLKNK